MRSSTIHFILMGNFINSLQSISTCAARVLIVKFDHEIYALNINFFVLLLQSIIIYCEAILSPTQFFLCCVRRHTVGRLLQVCFIETPLTIQSDYRQVCNTDLTTKQNQNWWKISFSWKWSESTHSTQSCECYALLHWLPFLQLLTFPFVDVFLSIFFVSSSLPF